MKRLMLAVLAATGLAACAAPTMTTERAAARQGEPTRMFDATDFRRLVFLEGRWSGQAPDGSTFYEAYDFPEAGRLRSQRYSDATFAQAGDGSTVSLEEGQIISRWGEFSWRATDVRDGYVAFEPINAPSRFSWRRVDVNHVEIVQSWTDANGVAQSYTVPLTRVGTR